VQIFLRGLLTDTLSSPEKATSNEGLTVDVMRKRASKSGGGPPWGTSACMANSKNSTTAVAIQIRSVYQTAKLMTTCLYAR
jgi:hypothetical protein